MSEDRTPVEVAAEAARAAVEARAGHVSTRLAQEVALAVFGSVDVDGLAEVLRDHGNDGTRGGRFACACGSVFSISNDRYAHQAEAVKAWLTNGEGA